MGLLLNDHALRHILPNASGYAQLIRQLDETKDMDRFRPKYVTFDCHGTLINFQMAEAARDLFGRLLDGPRMDEFIKNFSAYRLDEVMQDWKPFADVVHSWSAPAAVTTSHSMPKTLKRFTTASRPGGHIRTYARDWLN